MESADCRLCSGICEGPALLAQDYITMPSSLSRVSAPSLACSPGLNGSGEANCITIRRQNEFTSLIR